MYLSLINDHYAICGTIWLPKFIFLAGEGEETLWRGKASENKMGDRNKHCTGHVSHCHFIWMHHSFFSVCVCVCGCWQLVVCSHLFSLSSCLPVPNWFCLLLQPSPDPGPECAHCCISDLSESETKQKEKTERKSFATIALSLTWAGTMKLNLNTFLRHISVWPGHPS